MDRRKFLTGTGAALAGAATLNPLQALAESAERDIPGFGRSLDANPEPFQALSNDLSPYTGVWDDVKIRHLLRRAMFGVPYSQFVAAKGLGSMNAVVTKLLEDKPLPPSPGAWLDKLNTPDRTITDSVEKQKDFQNKQRLSRFEGLTLANWWFERMLTENLSIREKMTLMWSNHFVTGFDAVRMPAYMYTYNQMLRKNAMGNLKTFVYEMSIDPAMLVYLNGNQNTYQIKNGKTINNINENFGRELMELFTLDITDPKTGAKNYTETDIQEAAKALTGWMPSLNPPFTGQLNPQLHNNDNKTFFGQTGNFGLQDIINIIFAKDGGYTVAYFICQKIYTALVYWVPNKTVVDAMANLLIQSNWEMKPVLSALLSSAHFYDENAIGAQLKSPMEFMGSVVREFGLVLPPLNTTEGAIDSGRVDGMGYKIYNDANPTHSYLTSISGLSLGQELLNPPNVKGWAGGHAWINTGTLPPRKATSYIGLSFPNYFTGNAPRAKGVKITFDPMTWAELIPNADTMTSVEMTNALTDAYLAFDLGPNESELLRSIIAANQQPNNFYLVNENIAPFAQGMTLLPEFQLF